MGLRGKWEEGWIGVDLHFFSCSYKDMFLCIFINRIVGMSDTNVLLFIFMRLFYQLE